MSEDITEKMTEKRKKQIEELFAKVHVASERIDNRFAASEYNLRFKSIVWPPHREEEQQMEEIEEEDFYYSVR